MDLLQKEIKEEIAYYLGLSSMPGLKEKMEALTEAQLEQLYNFICSQQFNKVQKTVIAFQVKEDMMAMLEGKDGAFSGKM